MLRAEDIAKMIDHSLLNPALTTGDVIEGCAIAKKYGCISVCVRPSDVALAGKELKGSGVKTTTVIGFPHGSNKTEVKVFEAGLAIDDGAVELDMVLNIGRLLSGEYDYVRSDIKAVADAAHGRGALLKVILENAYLTPELIEKGCKLAEEAGADFVKTSTGYAPGGAKPEDLILMRKSVGPNMQVKAAGGVRTLGSALVVRKCGASRFGATATIAIMEEALRREREGTLTELGDDAPLELGSKY